MPANLIHSVLAILKAVNQNWYPTRPESSDKRRSVLSDTVVFLTFIEWILRGNRESICKK